MGYWPASYATSSSKSTESRFASKAPMATDQLDPAGSLGGEAPHLFSNVLENNVPGLAHEHTRKQQPQCHCLLHLAPRRHSGVLHCGSYG